ncbi:MAG: response regulator, partial [Lachnospiraceae bacterium]|nr:response regulator [Lachnospiraceae bacterium]
DPTMTRTIKNLLSPKYNVYMAGSGMNAITFLAKNSVDLILLDYEMPVVSGAKVLEMIRSEPATAGIPVMFLTGKSDRQTVMEVLALKPAKYLLKSMHPAEWIKEVDDFFAFSAK